MQPEKRITKHTIDTLLSIVQSYIDLEQVEQKANDALKAILPHCDFRGELQLIDNAFTGNLIGCVDAILEPDSSYPIISYYLWEMPKGGGEVDGMPIRNMDDVRDYVYMIHGIKE